MSFHPDSPDFAAERSPGRPPPVVRGPEMYQLDPLHEIRDQPRCEIGDLPPSVGGEPIPPRPGDPHNADAAPSGYSAR
jgi:hypothetical protein